MLHFLVWTGLWDSLRDSSSLMVSKPLCHHLFNPSQWKAGTGWASYDPELSHSGLEPGSRGRQPTSLEPRSNGAAQRPGARAKACFPTMNLKWKPGTDNNLIKHKEVCFFSQETHFNKPLHPSSFGICPLSATVKCANESAQARESFSSRKANKNHQLFMWKKKPGFKVTSLDRAWYCKDQPDSSCGT